MAEQVSHSDRDHATWSASATERNWNCEGALAFTDGMTDTESEAAAWGTACHTVAERCLRGKGPADKHIGDFIKTKSHEIEVDDEMAECAQEYVDFVVSRIDSADDSRMQVEQHFTLASLKPPFDAGGTADAVIYLPGQKMLEVIDLKGGRGRVVEVKNNPQLRTYALGAMLANPGLDVTHIRAVIVQPRAAHKDGRIRDDTFHVADLVEWTSDLMLAMGRSNVAKVAYQKVLAGDTSLAEWASTYLKPGLHCDKTFCKARGNCPALKQAVLDQVGIWFDDNDQPRLTNNPNPDDPAQLARDLDMLDMIEGWAKNRREHAHRLAEQGVAIADPASGSTYILVPKEGREKWNADVEDKVRAAAKGAGLPPDKYINPGKLRTPKQVRKELGPKASLVAGLSTTPTTGSNLVRQDKTSRAPIGGTASRFFEPQP